MAVPTTKSESVFGHSIASYTQYEQQMNSEMARQMLNANQMMIGAGRRDKNHLGIKVTKIGNGLMVNINGDQLYGATPQDIADLIAAQWTRLQLEAK
jgi:hypothetical protein